MGNVRSILRAPDQTQVTIPRDYVVPPFPSLYPPTLSGRNAIYLYFAEDMWRFTFYWTLIVFGFIHLACSLAGTVALARKHPFLGLVVLPAAFTALGVALGALSSTIVGFALASIYNSSGFNMATWVPFLFALVQGLVLILGSYNTLSPLL